MRLYVVTVQNVGDGVEREDGCCSSYLQSPGVYTSGDKTIYIVHRSAVGRAGRQSDGVSSFAWSRACW
jgi:hypothetical protein